MQHITLNNIRVQKDYYTVRQVSEIYHVSMKTVRHWIKNGWVQAHMPEPVTKGAKKSHWRVFPQSIEDMEVNSVYLTEASKRYWPYLWSQQVKRYRDSQF